MTQTLSHSNSRTSIYKEVTQNGVDWLVVNCVALVEGVLNSRFVASKEFGKFVQDWNGVPVVVRHPKQNGGSAKVPSPDVPVVGYFYNAKMDDKRLVGECWLDKTHLLAANDGATIISRIKMGDPIEVSTGYWSNSLGGSGDYNGIEFALVDTEIHPDHIAILPDDVGACSLQDGCGLVRNSSETSQEPDMIDLAAMWSLYSGCCVAQNGGEGSGNFGHEGRPGEIGGSSDDGQSVMPKAIMSVGKWKKEDGEIDWQNVSQSYRTSMSIIAKSDNPKHKKMLSAMKKKKLSIGDANALLDVFNLEIEASKVAAQILKRK